MENEPGVGGEDEIEKIPEGATDMELAIFLAGHIDNPCTVEVAPGQVENIRQFYLAEAKKLLPTMTNPGAKDVLEDKIKEYEK